MLEGKFNLPRAGVCCAEVGCALKLFNLSIALLNASCTLNEVSSKKFERIWLLAAAACCCPSKLTNLVGLTSTSAFVMSSNLM